MSWITQNKFLAGFAAVMVVGAGALGYLAYAAMDRSSAENENYESALAELKRLQGGHPYPEKANRDKIVEQKAAYQERITAFQMLLADAAKPAEPLSPTEFQDKLKETVARVSEKAAGDARLTLQQSNTAEKFYMGFPEYASGTPDKLQVPLLTRELTAFESIMNLMIAAKDVTLLDLTRVKAKEDQPKPTGAKPAAAAKPERKLLQHTSFKLKFESSDIAFRNILNGIVGNKEHFFIVRRTGVKNTKPEPPEKQAQTQPAEKKDKDQRLEYIFGTERVVADLEIELVHFVKPEVPPAKPDKKPKEAN